MSGYPSLLLVALATDLQTGGIGTWNAGTGTAYTPAQTGIGIGTMPSDPDRMIVLEDYPVSDAAALSDSVIGVQARCRWSGDDPLLVKDLAELIFQRWHGKTNWILSAGIVIAQCLRNSGPLPLGQDSLSRYSNTQNFYMYVWRPSTNRT